MFADVLKVEVGASLGSCACRQLSEQKILGDSPKWLSVDIGGDCWSSVKRLGICVRVRISLLVTLLLHLMPSMRLRFRM